MSFALSCSPYADLERFGSGLFDLFGRIRG
jgi:hypothetical protein